MQTPYVNKLNKLHKLHKQSNTSLGFTIVELLIVIVVIAILAAISITAYTNFQQRAKNTAIINAASQSLKMIQAYIVEHGTYPIFSTTAGLVRACVSNESGCLESSTNRPANSQFETNIAKIGQPPRSVPMSSGDRYGIWLLYWPASPAEGPLTLEYYLYGEQQQCGLGNVLINDRSSYSTTGYTNGNSGSSGKTYCVIHVPGPAHS